MEFHTLELTIEDMLQLHRGWISKLYLEERKTEMEILELLQERRLFVRPQQLRNCIQDWDLDQAITPPSSRSSISTDMDWESLSSQRSSEQTSPSSYTPSHPDLMSLYIRRPLPSLPSPNSQSPPQPQHLTNKLKTRADSLTTSWLGLSYHLEATSRFSPHQPTAIERYIAEEQEHERLGMGVERVRAFAHRRSLEFRVGGGFNIRILRAGRRASAKIRRGSKRGGKR